MQSTGVFIHLLLFLACFCMIDSCLVALRQRIEGLDAPPFRQPVLLPSRRQLMGLSYHFPCLVNCSIESIKERLIVSPLVARQPFASGSEKLGVILVAVLGKQLQALGGLLFTGDELTESPSRFLQFHLGEV